MSDVEIKLKMPEMRERRTEMPDGRYLIYYEFSTGEETVPVPDAPVVGTEPHLDV